MHACNMSSESALAWCTRNKQPGAVEHWQHAHADTAALQHALAACTRRHGGYAPVPNPTCHVRAPDSGTAPEQLYSEL